MWIHILFEKFSNHLLPHLLLYPKILDTFFTLLKNHRTTNINIKKFTENVFLNENTKGSKHESSHRINLRCIATRAT